MHRRFASSVIFTVLFFGVSSLSADVVVATWPAFSGGTSAAQGGQQAGTATLNSGGGVATSGGSTLYLIGNQISYNMSTLDISFKRSGLHDFVLTYDVVRADGSGFNQGPSAIQWSYSADSGPFVPVSLQSIVIGENSHSIDFSSLTGVESATNLVFHAKFAGSVGEGVSSLGFDNFRIVAVPEPGSFLALVLIGGPAFFMNRRRRV